MSNGLLALVIKNPPTPWKGELATKYVLCIDN
jgi:hypothetical protein